MVKQIRAGLLAAGLAALVSACGGSSGGSGGSVGGGAGGGESGGNGGESGGGVGGGNSGTTVNADFHTLRTPPLETGQFELLTLSTLPDAVTGGDVLMAIRGLPPTAGFTVTRNGTDVTALFARQNDGEIRGLMTGLAAGENTLVASSGDRNATLTLRNHPVTGPVLSGPHQAPFACRTEQNGLGTPLDANCTAEPKFQWFYRSSLTQGFAELADPFAPYPSDTMTTTTSDRRAVPFVVRVESRTINRGIARIAVLDDPAARGPDAPFAPNSNHRMFYVYGESCGVGYTQGNSAPAFVLGDLGNLQEVSGDNLLINLAGVGDRLGKGDVVVHNTLSAFGVHCNPFISIETAMMMKEHVIEQYGPVEAVVGTNGSGAALQQYNAINNAPGLLSAGMPSASFADIASTAMTVSDCGLLQHYYANSSLDWNDQKKAAVNGHSLLSGNQLNAICQSWTDAFFDRLDPTTGCSVPEDQRYHPIERPNGVRCTVQDANVNWLGRDPQTGFARRPLDNVGIQYGLAAFNAGTISFEEFLDLNRNIGGLDMDANFIAERHAMDPEVEALLYRVGQVIGRGALAETPVMDIAPYLDLIPVANIHEAIRPFTIRARLLAQSGQGVTQSIWRGVLTQPDAFPTIDQWLLALRDTRPEHGGDHVQAVVSAKPADAADRCVIGTVGGRLELPDQILGPLGVQAPLLPGLAPLQVQIPLRIDVPENFDAPQSLGPCGLLLPVTGTPRMVAGMPQSDDIIKCQLKPVDPDDYASMLSAAQLDELREIFPDGVCDYSRPAAGDVERSLIWPSVGTEPDTAPFELKWRVARSS
jgi:hypothetical protein